MLHLQSGRLHLAVVAVLLLLHGNGAQVPFRSPCPKLQVVRNFDTQRYLGRWYEIEKYPNAFQKFGSCTTATYSNLAGGAIRVLNRSFNTSSKCLDSATGRAEMISADLGAKLGVTFPNSAFQRPVPAEGNYWVLDTDYDNYSIVWSCESFSGNSFQLLWHLNRKKLPDSVQVASIHQRIDSFGLDRSFLKKTDQVNCPDAEDASASPSQPTKAIY